MENPTALAEEARRAFEAKRFDEAADLFEKAAKSFSDGRDGLNAAEMRNNMSVAYLQAGKAQQAFDATAGTDVIFAAANDAKREGIALANQAAALEDLKRLDEAIVKYEQAADRLRAAGEGDMRSTVMKAGAALKLKQGRVTESAFKMMGALDAKDKPSLFERVLRFFTRFIR